MATPANNVEVLDNAGTPLQCGDVVWLNVYAPKDLNHTGITRVCGQIVSIDRDRRAVQQVEVAICGSANRWRPSRALLKANASDTMLFLLEN